MNKLLTSAALVAVAATATAATAADAPAKVKCYGISKAGKNDCKAADGSHSCAGQSKTDNSKSDWKYATAADCTAEKGSTTPPAPVKK